MAHGEAARRFIPAPPVEMEHVLRVWNLVGGRLRWSEVLIAAEFVEGDAEWLVSGLVAVRDEVTRHREEKLNESRKAST